MSAILNVFKFYFCAVLYKYKAINPYTTFGNQTAAIGGNMPFIANMEDT
jgi:hypothetical protein